VRSKRTWPKNHDDDRGEQQLHGHDGRQPHDSTGDPHGLIVFSPVLTPPDVLVGQRLAQLEVVVGRNAVAGVHHQIRCRPQVAGDRRPAAGFAAGSAATVDPRQVVRIHVGVLGARDRHAELRRIVVAALQLRNFWSDVGEIPDGAEHLRAVGVQ